MLLAVTPNPAYDVTYTVDAIELGSVHRVRDVAERAGGKGVNVARVLTQLGADACATGFGDRGFAAALERIGLGHEIVEALPKVRRTLVLRDGDTTTSFWEPGAELTSGGEDALYARFRDRLPDASGAVISGSLPTGCDPALPAKLASAAVAAGVPVVVDTHGEPLRIAAQVPGVVLMPNGDELTDLAGPATTLDECVAAGSRLLDAGVYAVIATRGSDGMLALTADGRWYARPTTVVDGNPTGAGDAAAAAVIRGLSRPDSDWTTLLREAVAVSAAAVSTPVAGEIDTALARQLDVDVRELTRSP